MVSTEQHFSDYAFDVLPEHYHTTHRETEEIRLVVCDANKGTIVYDMFSNLANYFDSNDMMVWNNVGISPSRLQGRTSSGDAIDVCFLFQREDMESTWEVVVLCEQGFPDTGTFDLARGAITGEFLGKTLEFDGASWLVKNRYKGYRGLVKVDQVPSALRSEIERTGLYMHPWYTNLNELPKGALNPMVTTRGGGVLIAEPARRLNKTILGQLESKGVGFMDVSIEMNFGWRPASGETKVEGFEMNPETFEVNEDTIAKLKSSLKDRKRITSVGTGPVRALERLPVPPVAMRSTTDIFISPGGWQFKYVDSLLTNLHSSMSTHVIMTCAFAGKDLVMEACHQAVREGYRFGVHGDAMLAIGAHAKLGA
jgi:S-adenosylmethionine:tRNA ribosyltransferase-isomerase